MSVVAIAAAMIFSAGSLAGQKTTAPSKKVTVMVLINDQGIRVFFFAAQMGPDGQIDPGAAIAVTGGVPRGDYVSIDVYNRGKKAHNFAILGKKTSSIKPGGKAHLFVSASMRGAFPYRSTLDTGKAFRGQITVY